VTSNHFSIFDIKQTFDVDMSRLSSRYRDLQSAVHPDRFANSTDAEKRAAMDQAVLVNDAYNTLRDPVKRAMHLLALRGIDGMDEKNTSMPHDFLIEQIEWREAIADAKLKEDVDRLEEMNTELQSIVTSLGNTFAAAYEGGHSPTATTLARKMRFMQKLIEEVDQAIATVEG
jgi:molecular chaperone HscB